MQLNINYFSSNNLKYVKDVHISCPKKKIFVSSIRTQVLHTEPVQSIGEKGEALHLILTLNLQLHNFVFHYLRCTVISLIHFH